MTTSVCTLYEGRYHIGVAALVNSLYENGFRGTVFVGFRGDLPPWASTATKDNNNFVFEFAPDARICFIPISTELHLTNYKPAFMQLIFAQYVSPDSNLCYLDPDIVVKCRWSFIEEWVENGLSLVEDCSFPNMPQDHPLRYGWMRVTSNAGLTQKRWPSRYYNGGFVGLPWRYRDVLKKWEDLVYIAAKAGMNPSQIAVPDRTALWGSADQDLLNILVMTTDVPMSTLSPDGMDFAPNGYVLSHAAVSYPKPWAKNYFKEALRGLSPSIPDKNFWKFTEHPIRIFPASYVKRQRLVMMISIAIGRFYNRN